jgi:hypothetical protein
MINKYAFKKFFLFTFIIALSFLNGCSKECYKSDLQLRAAYEHCSDLGVSFSQKIKQNVRTFVCSGQNGDNFIDFVVNKDAQYCRTFQHEY